MKNKADKKDADPTIQTPPETEQKEQNTAESASGTEPIVRVMLEGEDTGMISGMAEQIVKKIVERHG